MSKVIIRKNERIQMEVIDLSHILKENDIANLRDSRGASACKYLWPVKASSEDVENGQFHSGITILVHSKDYKLCSPLDGGCGNNVRKLVTAGLLFYLSNSDDIASICFHRQFCGIR